MFRICDVTGEKDVNAINQSLKEAKSFAKVEVLMPGSRFSTGFFDCAPHHLPPATLRAAMQAGRRGSVPLRMSAGTVQLSDRRKGSVGKV